MPQQGDSDPQREFVLEEVGKECGSWLLGHKARAGGGRVQGEESNHSGWKVIPDWLWL